MNLKSRINSFVNAGKGICYVIKNETNIKIHLFAFFVVIIAGFVFSISIAEWLCIIIVSGLVISAELFNSSIEKTADFISPIIDERIKIIKDISAGAVFIAAITAIIIGLIVFIPKIINL